LFESATRPRTVWRVNAAAKSAVLFASSALKLSDAGVKS
jgi:hypothetical protein